MKSLLIGFLLLSSMNTFGQDKSKNPLEQIKSDIDFYSKYLNHCQTAYKKFVDDKHFTKFNQPAYKIAPMVADSTAVNLPEIGRFGKQEQEIESAYKDCDKKLRADAELNHVQLPTIEDILEKSPLLKGNQFTHWECWAGPYVPAVISVTKSSDLTDVYIDLREDHFNRLTFKNTKKLQNHFSSIDVNVDSKLTVTAKSDTFMQASWMMDDFKNLQDDGKMTYYNCVPLNLNKYGLTGLEINNAGKSVGKKVGSKPGKSNDADGDAYGTDQN